MRILTAVCAASVCLATIGYAHTGVTNMAVMARMEAMRSIGGEMKILGMMVKGQAEYDPDLARETVEEIARLAARVPALFEAYETDPMSEASEAIWEDFEGFAALSRQLERDAAEHSAAITTASEVRLALVNLGQDCQACHERFRE